MNFSLLNRDPARRQAALFGLLVGVAFLPWQLAAAEIRWATQRHRL
jgi:hypothetical protein